MVAVARAQDTSEGRRSIQRVRVAWKVKVITASGMITTCTVQDVSDGGARLAIPPDAALPDRFHLYYPLRDLSNFVEVRWRKEGEIGVAFIDGLETELRELRITVAHLTERLESLERAMRIPEPPLAVLKG